VEEFPLVTLTLDQVTWHTIVYHSSMIDLYLVPTYQI